MGNACSDDKKEETIVLGEQPLSRDLSKAYNVLIKAFIFNNLSEMEKFQVLITMQKKNYNDDEVIIKQGEKGEEMFIVEKGKLDCFKFQNGQTIFLKTYQAGESFGDLSLLYDQPRGATIISKGSSVLWRIDKQIFNDVLKEKALLLREKYEKFLANVEMFKPMQPIDRKQIIESLKWITYKTGDYVFKKGDEGNQFYIVEDGQCHAIIEGATVMKYNQGMFFGELALLRDKPRFADIFCVTDVLLAYIDKNTFDRLILPLTEVLEANLNKYKTYAKNVSNY